MLKDKYEFKHDYVTKKSTPKFNKPSLFGIIPWIISSIVFLTIQIVSQNSDGIWILPIFAWGIVMFFVAMFADLDYDKNIFLLWRMTYPTEYAVRGLNPKNASHPIYQQAMDDMLVDIKSGQFDRAFWSETFTKLNLEMPKTPLTQRDRVNYVEMMKDMNKLMELP